MTSPFDDIYSQLGAPAVRQFFADSVSHHPQGGAGVAVPTAVFHEDEPTLDRAKGKVVKRNGSVNVPSSLTLHPQDYWTIGGERWDVNTIALPVGGVVQVRVQRWEKQYTNQAIEVQ